MGRDARVFSGVLCMRTGHGVLRMAIDHFAPTAGADVHFLTHMHTDHLAGLSGTFSGHIYCSNVSKKLLRIRFPDLDASRVTVLEDACATQVRGITVTPFASVHCPGSLMFLFEGADETVLHTGDVRFDARMAATARLLASRRITRAFIDTTFDGDAWDTFPTHTWCIDELVRLAGASRRLHVCADMLGAEPLLAGVAERLATRVFARDATRRAELRACGLGDLLTTEATDARVHVCTRDAIRAREAAGGGDSGDRGDVWVQPSTQWFVHNRYRGVRRWKARACASRGVWHVLHSIHSSREEVDALRTLLHDTCGATVGCIHQTMRSKRPAPGDGDERDGCDGRDGRAVRRRVTVHTSAPHRTYTSESESESESDGEPLRRGGRRSSYGPSVVPSYVHVPTLASVLAQLED